MFGTVTKRLALNEPLARYGEGDGFILCKPDHLGRSLPHLFEVIQYLNECERGFRSLVENIDTKTACARLVFRLMGAFAEFERVLIAERAKTKLAVAQTRRRRIGCKCAMLVEQVQHARTLLKADKR